MHVYAGALRGLSEEALRLEAGRKGQWEIGKEFKKLGRNWLKHFIFMYIILTQ